MLWLLACLELHVWKLYHTVSSGLQGLPAALASPIFGELLDMFNGDSHLDSVICKHTLRLATILSASYARTNAAEACSALQEVFGDTYEGVSRGGNFSYSRNLAELLTQLLRDKLGGSQALPLAYVLRVGQLQSMLLSEGICEACLANL